MTGNITNGDGEVLICSCAITNKIIIIAAGLITINAATSNIQLVHPGIFTGQKVLLDLPGHIERLFDHFMFQAQGSESICQGQLEKNDLDR